MQSDERLIVALDFPTANLAKTCVEELGDFVCHYKVGMELYYAAGSEIIRPGWRGWLLFRDGLRR